MTVLRLLLDNGLSFKKVSFRLARESSSDNMTDCAMENGLVHDTILVR